jgi:Glycosyl hydrolases family 43
MSVACALLAVPAAASAATNPVRLYGAPMSCPDPDVFTYGKLYVAACTSDFGQDNPEPGRRMGEVPAAFPMYVSSDLAHWRFVNFIFPPGHSVTGAKPILGNWPGGEFWAPEIHYIDGEWVVYFGADRAGTKTFGIFVAWTKHLFGGSWQSRLLHRSSGSAYDPSVARDPSTGILTMVWSDGGQVLIGHLSNNGLRFLPGSGHVAFRATLPWEDGVTEGPVVYAHAGRLTIFYNAADTWANSYAIGNANPLVGKWTKLPRPVLHSGNGLVSTGIGAQPFQGPRHMMIAFHVQLGSATHSMEGRYLSFAPLNWHGNVPSVAGGVPPKTFR